MEYLVINFILSICLVFEEYYYNILGLNYHLFSFQLNNERIWQNNDNTQYRDNLSSSENDSLETILEMFYCTIYNCKIC